MSCSHTIFPDHGLGVITLHDVVTGHEVAQGMTALYTDDLWTPGFATLWDTRRIRELVVVPSDVMDIAARSSELVERQGIGKIAVAVDRNLDADVARLLLLRRKSRQREAQVFRRITEALAWLGISDPSPELVDLLLPPSNRWPDE